MSTEALNEPGEEFGEQRLIEALRPYREMPPHASHESIIHDVQRFSPHDQHDHITLILAKCKEK